VLLFIRVLYTIFIPYFPKMEQLGTSSEFRHFPFNEAMIFCA
jgi:hypothetical protein